MNPLGLIPGQTYTVVTVRCTEKTCLSYAECGIECGAIGLLDGQKSQDMICKTYQSIHDWREQEKRVTWERSCQDAIVCPECQKGEDPIVEDKDATV